MNRFEWSGIAYFVSGVCLGWAIRAMLRTEQKVAKENEDNVEESQIDIKNCQDFKMVIVVRTDLQMGKGKMAAQCCHGAIANLLGCSQRHAEMVKKWQRYGSAKVVVKAPNEETLLRLKRKARELGLEANVIADAGRTQIAAGSLTVLAVGPGPREIIDQVTGELKLM